MSVERTRQVEGLAHLPAILRRPLHQGIIPALGRERDQYLVGVVGLGSDGLPFLSLVQPRLGDDLRLSVGVHCAVAPSKEREQSGHYTMEETILSVLAVAGQRSILIQQPRLRPHMNPPSRNRKP